MFDKIKSFYIQKEIISFLSDDKNLELIKYNKNIQAKLYINIRNYKLCKGIYKIVEKNGKGKEYNHNDVLIFEGE